MYLPLCLLLLLCIKAHARKRKGKAQDGPNGCLLCSLAKQKRDSMGTVFSSRACRLSQIPYLQPEWVCMGPRSPVRLSLLMQSRAITIPAQIVEHTASPRVGLITRPLCSLCAVISAVAETLKIGIKSYRATGTINRAAEMTHRQVITTLIRLSSSFKGVLVSKFCNFSKVSSCTSSRSNIQHLIKWRKTSKAVEEVTSLTMTYTKCFGESTFVAG